MGQRRQIDGSRILITGASQGIGRALAQAAVRRGGLVLAAARQLDLLQELAAQTRGWNGRLEIVQADVTVAEDRQRMADAAVEHFGGLDILINNAGIGATGQFADANEERMRQIFEVNFFGLTETTRVCLPLLKKGNKPAIVNISSVAGKRAIPSRSEYSASKFAVQGFSEAIRAELAKDDVDVLVICPGLTQTNFSQNMIEQKARVRLDHLRGMTAEQVAEATLRAIERGKHETYLTWQGKLIIYISRFFPRLADRIAAKRVRKVWADEIAARQAAEEQPQPVRHE
ncbi:MAG: SDR family oxidoreductase [Gemmataceae bacterium]